MQTVTNNRSNFETSLNGLEYTLERIQTSFVDSSSRPFLLDDDVVNEFTEKIESIRKDCQAIVDVYNANKETITKHYDWED